MIKSICFSEKAISARRDKLKIADPGLFEKAIHAFALLGHIAESRMDFIFKGGTSLLLHIPQPQRGKEMPFANRGENYPNNLF
jgi:RNA 3'-terminal phosphate cyclase